MIKCPHDHDSRDLRHFLGGGYCASRASFDEQRYQQCWHPSYFLVLNFIHRFNRRGYEARNGDPVQFMVACEIWLYNIGRMLALETVVASEDLADSDKRRKALPKCNAYSLSQALGVPAQTVRRKVKQLIEHGWVERTGKGELLVTVACEAAMNAEFNLETMRDFVSTARTVLDCLGEPPSQALACPGGASKSA